MYPIKEHSITQTYKSFHAITLKDAWENAFFVLMDKLLRCALQQVHAGNIPSQAHQETAQVYLVSNITTIIEKYNFSI